MSPETPSNAEIAEVLDGIARLLEVQHANPFKIKAYQSGAAFVRTLSKPLSAVVFSGDGESLQELPTIGQSLAAVIEEYVRTGRSQLLQRLKGEVTPEEVFEQIPGLGKALAGRIVQQLDVKTLEDLEQAAYDGRLSTIPGFGRRRTEAIRAVLAGILSSSVQRRIRHRQMENGHTEQPYPSVKRLLAVDEEYRRKAAAGLLKTIAPKRFNPGNDAWLPVMHIDDEGSWSFTALFSNTARAHELGKTRDWVVIYYEKNGYEGQCTVVTETNGPLEGLRVVRGREAECRALLA